MCDKCDRRTERRAERDARRGNYNPPPSFGITDSLRSKDEQQRIINSRRTYDETWSDEKSDSEPGFFETLFNWW